MTIEVAEATEFRELQVRVGDLQSDVNVLQQQVEDLTKVVDKLANRLALVTLVSGLT